MLGGRLKLMTSGLKELTSKAIKYKQLKGKNDACHLFELGLIFIMLGQTMQGNIVCLYFTAFEEKFPGGKAN